VSFRIFDVSMSAEERAVLLASNRALQHLRMARRSGIVALSFPGRVSWALDSLMQYCLHRIVSIGTGMTAEWNKKRFLNCIILGRSLLETVGSWFRVLDETHELLETQDIRKIHLVLMVAMFGNRDAVEGDRTLPFAVNALSGIDRLDRAYPGARKVYDGICEYVHPNADGFHLFGNMDAHSGDTELGEHLQCRMVGTLSTATLGAHYLWVADHFRQRYDNLFRERVEALDRKYGENMDTWPGDPAVSWRKPR
jgi:hypothetical protein